MEFGFYEQSKLKEGTAVEVRIGRPSGKLIGRGDLSNNDSSVEISPTVGFEDVFFVFRNETQMEEELGMLDWIMFGF